MRFTRMAARPCDNLLVEVLYVISLHYTVPSGAIGEANSVDQRKVPTTISGTSRSYEVVGTPGQLNSDLPLRSLQWIRHSRIHSDRETFYAIYQNLHLRRFGLAKSSGFSAFLIPRRWLYRMADCWPTRQHASSLNRPYMILTKKGRSNATAPFCMPSFTGARPQLLSNL